MYVETIIDDVLEGLAEKKIYGTEWFYNFLFSIHDSVHTNNPLTSRQSEVFIDYARRYKTFLYGKYGKDEVDLFFDNPVHARPIKQSTIIPKEVRYLGNNLLGFRFKKDDEIIKEFKQKASWDFIHKIWVVQVTSHNIDSIMEVIAKYKFSFDSDVEQYFFHCLQSKNLNSYASDKEVVVFNNDFLKTWVERSLL